MAPSVTGAKRTPTLIVGVLLIPSSATRKSLFIDVTLVVRPSPLHPLHSLVVVCIGSLSLWDSNSRTVGPFLVSRNMGLVEVLTAASCRVDVYAPPLSMVEVRLVPAEEKI